jgi:hypothetical protein
MGVWGTGIFSDNTACDVRDSYIDLVGDGLTGPEATKALLREWSPSLNSPEEASQFWLALAATQFKCGRLEPQVLRQALNVIDGGSDEERWESGSRDFKKRKGVLAKLRAQLISPPPPEKRIPKRFKDTNEWQVGDLIAYRMQSGRFIILRAIGHHRDRGGTSPICELLDWSGEQIPQSFGSVGVRKSLGPRPMTQFMIGRTRLKERPDNRLRVLGVNMTPSQRPDGCTVLLWRRFDKILNERFGLE